VFLPRRPGSGSGAWGAVDGVFIAFFGDGRFRALQSGLAFTATRLIDGFRIGVFQGQISKKSVKKETGSLPLTLFKTGELGELASALFKMASLF
jgi:hypothetical protein